MTEYINYEPPARTLTEKAHRIVFSLDVCDRLEALANLVLEMAQRLEELESGEKSPETLRTNPAPTYKN